jgi:hypothetical protein
VDLVVFAHPVESGGVVQTVVGVFQTAYRLSIAYQGSVVLIESEKRRALRCRWPIAAFTAQLCSSR